MIVTYNGLNFNGFQKQKSGNTIQDHLNTALKTLLKHEVLTVASGRTDAKVSAYCQPVHFETDVEINEKKFINSMNGILPRDIKVLSISKTDKHARFDAKSKTYVYKMFMSDIDEPLKSNSLRISKNINIRNMKKFLHLLVGTHDFKGFQSSGSPTDTTIRKIFKAKLHKSNNNLTLEISGNGFLYKMVRNIVGTMLLVGENKLNLKELKTTLFSTFKATATTKPEFLYLYNVKYWHLLLIMLKFVYIRSNFMEEKNNLAAALLLSLLICLAGSVVWGLIYYAGYFVAYIAMLVFYVAIWTYSKFNKASWKAILWLSILIIVLNEVSIYIADVFVVKSTLDCSFSEAITTFNSLFGTTEILSTFVKDSLINVLFTCIGVGLYVYTYFKAVKAKQQTLPNNKQTQNQQTNTNQEIKFNYTPNQLEQPKVILMEQEETIEERLENDNLENEELTILPQQEEKPKSDNPLEEIASIETVSNLLLADFNEIINKFKTTNDKELLKADLKTFKETKIATLSEEKKLALKSMVQYKIDYTNTSLEDKKNFSILINLIK